MTLPQEHVLNPYVLYICGICCSCTEYPIPRLGSVDTIRHQLQKKDCEDNHSAFTFTYKDLMDLDSVTVRATPGKKGMVLKHVEYDVECVVSALHMHTHTHTHAHTHSHSQCLLSLCVCSPSMSRW